MPLASLRPCRTRLCASLVRGGGGGYCPACSGDASGARQVSKNALYGRRWKKHSRWFRGLYPACGDRPPGCRVTGNSLCRAEGRYNIGTKREPNVCDHVRPLTGPNDPTYLDADCHETLCGVCHAVKRQRESLGR